MLLMCQTFTGFRLPFMQKRAVDIDQRRTLVDSRWGKKVELFSNNNRFLSDAVSIRVLTYVYDQKREYFDRF